MFDLSYEKSGVYNPPRLSSPSSSSTRQQNLEVVHLKHLARHDIKELKKVELSESSDADVNKKNDDRKRILRERLKFYFSTTRDSDYYEKLNQNTQSIIIELKYKSCYSDLRTKVLKAAKCFLKQKISSLKALAKKAPEELVKNTLQNIMTTFKGKDEYKFDEKDFEEKYKNLNGNEQCLNSVSQKNESGDLLIGETLCAKLFEYIVQRILEEIVLGFEQSTQAADKKILKNHNCPLTEGLRDYLTTMVQAKEFKNFLADIKLDQVDKHLNAEKNNLDAIQDKLIAVQDLIAEYTSCIAGNRQMLERHSVVVKNKKESSHSASKLVSQTIDIFSEEDDKTLLDEAVKLGDINIIADMLAYGKSNLKKMYCKDGALEKIQKSDDPIALLQNLIGGAYLSDLSNPDLGEELRRKYQNPSVVFLGSPVNNDQAFFLESTHYVAIATKMLDQANDDDLICFIEKAGNPTWWPHNDSNQWKRIDKELRRRYIDKDEKMPDEVWQALKERQKKHRHFEKLAHVYEDAIIHVINKSNKKLNHYAAKATSLLQQISDAVESPATLAKQAEDVGNDLVQTNHKIAERGCSIFALSKTQRLVENARDKVIASPELCQTLEPDVSPAKANVTKSEINAILVSLQGDEQDQKVRRQRAALARAAFKKTLQYLEKQCNKENPDRSILQKKEIVEGLITLYSSGECSGVDFIKAVNDKLNKPSNDGITLRSKRNRFCCCSIFWAKSAKLLDKELKASKKILSAYLRPPTSRNASQ